MTKHQQFRLVVKDLSDYCERRAIECRSDQLKYAYREVRDVLLEELKLANIDK